METTGRNQAYWRAVLNRSGLVLAAAAAVAIALLPGLARLETNNSAEVFFVESSDEVSRYRAFQDSFGSDQALRLLLEGDAIWSGDGLRFLANLEEELGRLDGVIRASGLIEHHRRFGWPRDPSAFKEEVLSNSLDRAAGWVGERGLSVSCLVQTGSLPPEQRDALFQAIEALLAEAPPGIETQILGLGALNAELDQSSREIEQRFFPMLVVLAIVLLALAVRSLRHILAPLIFVALCQLLTLGPMGYAGASLNMVLAVLPPIIFVIALATALHLVLRIRHIAATHSGLEWREVVVAVFARKGWAIFWTGVTTATGFASLTVSDLAPVRHLGAWAASGLALTTVAAFTVLPALIYRLGQPRGGVHEAGFEQRVADWGGRWARFAARRRRQVLTTVALISTVALLGLPRLTIESDALRYLAPNHPLRVGVEKAERQGIGVAALELLITAPPSGSGAPATFVSALQVDQLADLATELTKLDSVYGVLNAGVVLRDALLRVAQTPMNAHLRPQMTLDGLAQDAQGREVLDTLLSEDRLIARSTIFVATSGVEQLEQLEAQILSLASVRFPDAEATITGEYRLLLAAQRSLISTLVFSLALTLLAVACVLRLLLPGFRLSLLALVPNLWPVLGGLGLMGWVGIPLDIATVMMASVVLGLAVDDTVHTLGHFRRSAPKEGAARAVEHTLHATAPAYLLTGAILMAGFGVCGLSDFAPIARFGLLSAFSIGLAVIGDLIILPALLSLTPDAVCRRLGGGTD